MTMYEKLEAFNALACVLLERLNPVSSGDVSGMRQQWPAAPDEYFAFMQERGHGEIKEDDCALSLLTIQPTLCPAVDYFGDDGFYKDGPYESGAKGEVWLFGWDSTGTAFGFDSGDNWRLLEIDNMRWITRLDLSFSSVHRRGVGMLSAAADKLCEWSLARLGRCFLHPIGLGMKAC